MEKQLRFDKTVERWLKRKKCKVLRTDDGMLVAFKEGWWGWFEVKKSRNAPCRPLQPEKIEWAKANSYGVIVYPENFEKIKEDLEEILK